ncbi:MAG TPA: hypothetical protein VNH64_07995 [Parvularculaceae bacterium]|nr:hypothetical protein [Parvularculaceae bacterium]
MIRSIALVLFAVIALCGCATTYKEPTSRSPRALVSGKQKQCIIDCKAGVFIQAVNGVPVSTAWKTNGYYLTPGPAELLVAIQDAGLFGVCVLKINAVADEVYELSDEIQGKTFVVTARDKSGSTVASCTAEMGPAPPAANYVPIIIPVR